MEIENTNQDEKGLPIWERKNLSPDTIKKLVSMAYEAAKNKSKYKKKLREEYIELDIDTIMKTELENKISELYSKSVHLWVKAAKEVEEEFGNNATFQISGDSIRSIADRFLEKRLILTIEQQQKLVSILENLTGDNPTWSELCGDCWDI